MPDISETAGLEAQIEALIRKASDRLRRQLDEVRRNAETGARSAARVERGVIANGVTRLRALSYVSQVADALSKTERTSGLSIDHQLEFDGELEGAAGRRAGSSRRQ